MITSLKDFKLGREGADGWFAGVSVTDDERTAFPFDLVLAAREKGKKAVTHLFSSISVAK
jgi:hypothetical protein